MLVLQVSHARTGGMMLVFQNMFGLEKPWMAVFNLAMAILIFLKMSLMSRWLSSDFFLAGPPKTSHITARIVLHTWIMPLGMSRRL